VLPNAKDPPACCVKVGVHRGVTGTVAFDFLPPELGSRCRWLVVLRATVPEAAINEDCNSAAREDEVGSACKLGVEDISETDRKAELAQGHFWLGVVSTVARHAKAALLSR
jgi:hypothetical protein